MYKEVRIQIETLGFTVISYDFGRPWGGFLVINESIESNSDLSDGEA